MTGSVVIDTGPLVAYFCAREARHAWAVRQFATFSPPVLTCEAVLAETCFLISRQGVPAWRLIEKLRVGALRVGLDLETEAASIRNLMRRYANVPMSLADACLVRIAEITGRAICTLDSDFEIYRMHRKRRLNLIVPRKD